MQSELFGKTALVTGSSRGIGRAIAETLHKRGCRVALNARNADELEIAVSKLEGSKGFLGDVTRPDHATRLIEEVIREFGSLDILICNVGSGRSVSPGKESYQEWQRVFALNLWSATNSVEAAKGALASSKGVIVCISSICGVEVVAGAPVTYSVAKSALHAYVKGIARPLAEVGIRINSVALGNIIFDGSVWANKKAENEKAVDEFIEQNVCLKRLGTAEEAANLVVFLASPATSFATGAVWTLDGGQVHF